jgi:cyclopropane fatty-acyl-phospholipid synthase-like methyltransferase
MQNSPEYTKELERLHSRKSFGTATGAPNILTDFLADHLVTSILDFGCGKGTPLESLSSELMEIHSYDPITHPIELPEAVDLVYSRDVLEHIEPEQIDTVLEKLFTIGTKYQHHFIACHPSKKGLSDGRNAHLIVEKPEWWKTKIEQIPGWKIIFENIQGPKTKVLRHLKIEIVKYTVILEKT